MVQILRPSGLSRGTDIYPHRRRPNGFRHGTEASERRGDESLYNDLHDRRVGEKVAQGSPRPVGPEEIGIILKLQTPEPISPSSGLRGITDRR